MVAHLNVGILRDRDHQQRQRPAMVVTMAMTVASRGRSMKMAENTCQSPLSGGGGLATTGEPGRRLSIPCTTTCSPPLRPSSMIA